MSVNLPERYVELDKFDEAALREHAAQMQRNFDKLARDALGGGETVAVALVNGWVTQAGYGAPVVYKVGRLVVITAVLNGLAAANTTWCTLPVGARPLGQVGAALNYWSGAARVLGSTIVGTGGAVQALGNADGLTNRDFFNVNISFTAAR